MRYRNGRLRRKLLAALVDSAVRHSWSGSRDLYNVLPADLVDADEQVRRYEKDWRERGGVWVSKTQVDEARERAAGLHSQFKRLRAESGPGFKLRHLRLVRWFVLTGLPRFGKASVLSSLAAAICALSLVLSPFLFASLGFRTRGCHDPYWDRLKLDDDKRAPTLANRS